MITWWRGKSVYFFVVMSFFLFGLFGCFLFAVWAGGAFIFLLFGWGHVLLFAVSAGGILFFAVWAGAC